MGVGKKNKGERKSYLLSLPGDDGVSLHRGVRDPRVAKGALKDPPRLRIRKEREWERREGEG